MDFLRVFGVQEIRAFQGSEVRTRVRWYKAADDAAVFPGEHAFGFPVWDGDQYNPSPVIGTQGNRLEWARGTNPGLDGSHFEGNPAWFLNGVPADHANDAPAVCADVFDGTPLTFAFPVEETMTADARVSGSLNLNSGEVGNFEFVKDFDTDDFFDSENPDRLTAWEDGDYLVGYSVQWPTAGLTAATFGARLELNGTTPIVNSAQTWTDDNTPPIYVALYGQQLIRMSEGEFVQLEIDQTNAEDVGITGNGFLWIVREVVVPPTPDLAFYDVFQAADGTDLNGRVPTIGTLWTTRNGTWDIQSFHARCSSGISAGLSALVTANSTVANVRLRTRMSLVVGGSAGYVLRYTDNLNFWYIKVIQGVSLEIYDRIAGVFTQRGIVAVGSSANTFYDLDVVADGQSITATWNGVSVSYNSASFNETATIHGLEADNIGALYEAFSIEALP